MPSAPASSEGPPYEHVPSRPYLRRTHLAPDRRAVDLEYLDGTFLSLPWDALWPGRTVVRARRSSRGDALLVTLDDGERTDVCRDYAWMLAIRANG